MTGKVRFTVLEGGRDKQATINTVHLAVVPDSLDPLPVDVRVFEEDTYLVLTVDPVMRYTEEHPIQLMTQVMEEKSKKPGSVIINNISWYAIIHALDATPTWCQEWIKKAYRTALMLGEKKRVQKMGLPLLGSVHGNLPHEKSLDMLLQEIKSISFQHLKKILIMVPQQDCSKTKQYLHELAK
jgi:hypothetical protein